MKPHEELIQAYFEGPLPPEEATALNDWLRSNPENLDEFIFQVDLHDALREAPVPSLHERTPPPSRKLHRPRSAARRSKPSRVPGLLWGSIAACLAVAAGILVVSMEPDTSRVSKAAPAPRPVPAPEAKEPEPAPRPAVSIVRRPATRPPVPPSAESPRPPRPLATPPPPPEPIVPPRPERPVPKPEAARDTIVATATVERVTGSVVILTDAGERPAVRGGTLARGHGIRTTGADSAVLLKFADGTTVEAEADTSISGISDQEPRGKRLHVARGSVRAKVVKQPRGRPFSITTAHGTATVLGTTLQIAVDDRSMRLGVLEGRVQLRRRHDGRTVMVASGHYAVAGEGIELAVRKLSPWIDDSMAGFTAECSGDSVVLKRTVAGTGGRWAYADFNRAVPVNRGVYVTGQFVFGTLGGTARFEFTGKDNLKLDFSPQGIVTLQSRGPGGGWVTHGNAQRVDPSRPVRFELLLGADDRVECTVQGTRLHQGTQQMGRGGRPLRLGPVGQSTAPGVIGSFTNLKVRILPQNR